MTPSDRHRAALLLVLASIATLLAYWVGLDGPFLLDDPANLAAIKPWLEGKLELHTLLFERGAGTFGRPASMASFALNAWLTGFTPFSLKLGNLLIHVLCGLVLFGLLKQLLQRDSNLAPRASFYAGVVAALWLLHPLHASTVLYVVQRMAQLSALLILLGLWLYTYLRDKLETTPSNRVAWAIMLLVPGMTGLAFLAKENGILLPLLCAVVELAYYRDSRARTGRLFIALYVLIPITLGLLILAANPGRVLGWYSGRDFTLVERLLSQSRALCDYLWKLVFPNPPAMGIYTDDFVVSTSLLQPITTLASFALLAMLSVLAYRFRKRLPSIFFGWFFFLAAHTLEAGPIPLELYFEHRNYLPAVGILTAIVALANLLGRWLACKGLRPTRIGIPLLAGGLLVLAAGTHGRALVWQDERLIAESSLAAHPYSLRANAAVLSNALGRRDSNRVDQILETLQGSPEPRHRSLAHLYRFYASCVLNGETNFEDLATFSQTTPMPLTLAETMPLKFLYAATENGRCKQASNDRVGAMLAQLADRARRQPDGARPKILLRYFAAQFHVRERNWRAALPPARLAWQPNAEAGIAMPLILSQLGTRDIDGAEATLREAALRTERSNSTDQAGLRWLRTQIDSAREAYGMKAKIEPNQ